MCLNENTSLPTLYEYNYALEATFIHHLILLVPGGVTGFCLRLSQHIWGE